MRTVKALLAGCFALTFVSCATISMHDQYAFTQAVNLKVDSLSIFEENSAHNISAGSSFWGSPPAILERDISSACKKEKIAIEWCNIKGFEFY